MITNIIEDMDGRIISKQSYISAYNSYEFTPETRIKKESQKFLDEFDFLLGMLIPDESRNDFIISYLNKELRKYYSFSTDNAVGSYLFKSMKFLEELNIKELLFDSFNNDNPLEFKVLRYIEDILVSADIYKFFRFKDKLYFQLEKSSDVDILNKSSQETIENSKVSVGIIQNNKWVYGNRTFCRINGVTHHDIEKLPVFNENIIKRESASLDELKYILSDILNRKQFFFQDNVELRRDGEIYYIREFIYPTSFNNKPAIEVIFLDLTEEKRIEKEFDDLNRKLEAVLKLGKLAVCKVEQGRIYWSKEIFSTLGIAPEKLNLSQPVDTIEEFFHIIDEFLLKTDRFSSNTELYNNEYDDNHNTHLQNNEYDDNHNTHLSNKEGNYNTNLQNNEYDDSYNSYNENKNPNEKHDSSNLKLTNINMDSFDFALSPNSSKGDSGLKNQLWGLKPHADIKNQKTDSKNLDTDYIKPHATIKNQKTDSKNLDTDYIKPHADIKNRNPDLLEHPKASSVDSEFEKLILNNNVSIDSTPTKSYIYNSNSESSVELDYLNIYDKINDGNNNPDFSNLYDEISRQKSESDNINVKFGIKTKNDNIKIINCDFIIYDENPLNMTGYAQDITYDESLNSEFKQQLVNYNKLYAELQDSKNKLMKELEKKYRLLDETYFNINHNLELFMYLLSSYLSNNPDNLDNYYRIVQKRIEILFFNSKMHQKLETTNEIEFREFISNIVFYAFRDILKTASIEIDVDSGILIKRNEIDLLYLILCEFLLNSIDLNDNEFSNIVFKVSEDENHIYLDIMGEMMKSVDMDCLDLLKFVKRFKTTRLEDISIEDNDKTVKMLVKFINN